MKQLFTLLFLAFFALTTSAQEELLKLGLETRVDYQRQTIDGHKIGGESGFKGKYLNLSIEGNLGHGFTYAYRQRLVKANKEQSFFDATDWVFLTYTSPNNRWTLSGGKMVVAIGGYEYDNAPINNFFISEHSSQIPCYKFGAAITHTLAKGNDSFMFQVSESPFRNEEEMFAYNLMWLGKHGRFSTLYSLNAIEWAPSNYICYIALGNRLDLGRVVIDLDLMNRASKDHTFLLRNCTVIGQVKVKSCDYLDLFAKATYDVNRTSHVGDLCVAPGTELTRLGAGVECYPIKGKRNVRLHAAYHYTFGSCSDKNVLQDKQSVIDFGLTWRMNLLSFTPDKRK